LKGGVGNVGTATRILVSDYTSSVPSDAEVSKLKARTTLVAIATAYTTTQAAALKFY